MKKGHSVYSRITAKGTIIAISPIHLGGTGGDESTDLAMIKDGQGRYLLPGSGLTGAIRSALNEHFDDAKEDSAFGFQKGDKGSASLIFVEDAVVTTSVKPVIRQGVGINRFTGAASDKIKHDRAVLPAGSQFSFEMSVEPKCAEQANTVKGLLATLQSLLKDKKIRIGAAKTRALGQIGMLDDALEITEVVLEKDSIISFLKGSKSDVTDLPKPDLAPLKSLRITLDWQPVGPVMVKSERDGVEIDILPYTEQVNGETFIVLPGSGIKGAFRSRAELIVRTVKAIDLSSASDFLDQVRVPIVDEVFGTAPTGKGAMDGAQGALLPTDCISVNPIEPELALRVLSGDEANQQRLTGQEIAGGTIYKRTHNSIDRWTGGTAEGALYSVCEPWGIEWTPIVFDVDWGRLEDKGKLKDSLWLLCNLLLQADQGWIPLGFGGNHGLGDWKITGMTIEGWPDGCGGAPDYQDGVGITIPEDTKKELAYRGGAGQ